MFHEVEFLEDSNVCIITFAEGWHTHEGTEARAAIIQSVLEQADGPVTIIFDLSNVKLRFDGIMRATARLARGPDAPLRHPYCEQIIVVTTNPMARNVAKGLRTETFGALPITVCRSREEALALIYGPS